MEALFQCCFRLGVMRIDRGTDHHRVEAIDGKDLVHRGHTVGNSKVAGNFLGNLLVSMVDDHQFRLGMAQQSRNVCQGAPPPSANDRTANFLLHVQLLSTA